MNIAIETALSISAVIAFGQPAFAECKIWSYEDISQQEQSRARVFATSDLRDHDLLLAQAASLAAQIVKQDKRDFVDVFMTRPEDGTDRAKHDIMSSTVQFRYNPGDTPIIDSLMTATTVPSGADGIFESGMFLEARRKISDEEIYEIIGKIQSDRVEICSQ